MRLNSCINALRKLTLYEDSDILSSALDFYLKNEYLTPKYSFVVFWRLSTNKIDYSPSFFKISLKKDKYKNDLAGMPIERVHLIWPELSSNQRKLASSYEDTAPGIKNGA